MLGEGLRVDEPLRRRLFQPSSSRGESLMHTCPGKGQHQFLGGDEDRAVVTWGRTSAPPQHCHKGIAVARQYAPSQAVLRLQRAAGWEPACSAR